MISEVSSWIVSHIVYCRAQAEVNNTHEKTARSLLSEKDSSGSWDWVFSLTLLVPECQIILDPVPLLWHDQMSSLIWCCNVLSRSKIHNQIALFLFPPTVIAPPPPLSIPGNVRSLKLNQFHHTFINVRSPLSCLGDQNLSFWLCSFLIYWLSDVRNCISGPGLWSTVCAFKHPNNLFWSWAPGEGCFWLTKSRGKIPWMTRDSSGDSL